MDTGYVMGGQQIPGCSEEAAIPSTLRFRVSLPLAFELKQNLFLLGYHCKQHCLSLFLQCLHLQGDCVYVVCLYKETASTKGLTSCESDQYT